MFQSKVGSGRLSLTLLWCSWFPNRRKVLVLTTDPITTKDRLLDAAEELFTARGFDEVSVRELAAAADVNVAAVNYHFQGKDNLYQEVILRRFVLQREKTLAALEQVTAQAGGHPRLEDVIAALVREYLEGTLGQSSSGFLCFLARELNGTQGHAPDALLREMVDPVFAAFSRALLLARPGLRSEDLSWIIASIVAQVQHFVLRWKKRQALAQDSESLAVMTRVFPPLKLPVEEYIDEVTRHITRFSSAAVKALYPEVE